MTKKPHSPLTFVGQGEIASESQIIPYIIKRSRRIRCVRLEMRQQTGLTVVIPQHFSLEQVADIVAKKLRWINNKLAQYNQIPVPVALRKPQDGDMIPFLGRNLKLQVFNNGERNTIELEQDRLLIHPGDDDDLMPLLEFWYRKQAIEVIKRYTDKISDELELKYSRLTIRGQRTRWGSCSPKGNLNFNWKLVMAPENVISYVVLHEIIHLKEMNHSKKFWKLVEENCSEWRGCRKWLKEHEADLANWGLK